MISFRLGCIHPHAPNVCRRALLRFVFCLCSGKSEMLHRGTFCCSDRTKVRQRSAGSSTTEPRTTLRKCRPPRRGGGRQGQIFVGPLGRSVSTRECPLQFRAEAFQLRTLGPFQLDRFRGQRKERLEFLVRRRRRRLRLHLRCY